MRFKVVALLVTLGVLISAGVVSTIAVLGIERDATQETLTADWLSSERTTSISLRRDGTFAANGLSRCVGDVGVLLDGAGPQTDLTVTDGAGTWHVEPNDAGYDHFLIMDFRTPRPFQLRWQVDHVTWQFRPAEVTLVGLNPPTSADATVAHCLLYA
jgi:hypothetical protein